MLRPCTDAIASCVPSYRVVSEDSVTSRAASANENAYTGANGAPAHRSRACAGAPSEISFHEIPEADPDAELRLPS
jgi:hypothetical protein